MHFGLSSRSIRFRNECAAISAPRLLPHPTCTFPKKFCRSERTLLPAHLDYLEIPSAKLCFIKNSSGEYDAIFGLKLEIICKPSCYTIIQNMNDELQ